MSTGFERFSEVLLIKINNPFNCIDVCGFTDD